MIGISKNINAGSLEELLSNQIFNFYLSNISNDDSFSPTQGVLNNPSTFTTTCEFNTTGCYDGSLPGSLGASWVDFIPDKDLNATVSLNTNLTLFFCNKPSGSAQIQGLIDTTNSSSGGLLLYYSPDNTTTMNVVWDNGDSVTKQIILDSDERKNPHCFTVIINSTGRSVEIYFNNTFKANYSAVAGAPPATMGTNLIIGRHNEVNSRYFNGQFALMSFYNITLNQTLRDFIWNNGNPFVIINDTTPTVTMNFPKNKNTTHNKTIVFNFTINEPNGDKINYTLWANTNSIPNTNINQTLNATEGNFIFNYTFGIEIGGSINGTYYWRVNGTDNNSNNFGSLIFTFNITNNISSYNVTNVSITPSPLDVGTEAKCHFNITNKAGQEDIISISDQRWWLNGSLVVEAGNKTLSAGNVTSNSNITCEARINNGYGETAWTGYVNLSQLTVGDTTPPNIFGNSTQGIISFTTNDKVNITVNVTDAQGTIDFVRVVINRTGTSTITNDTMTLLGGNLYQFAQTYAVDTFKIVSFYARDGSQNIQITESSLNFTVTSAPSGNGGTTGGGGGGTTQLITIENQNQTSLFFGFTTFSFFVISTPSEQIKLIKFKNIGNSTFLDADVSVLGDASEFISASVCNINLTSCKNKNINILAGENKFLKLDANFTSELQLGSEGIIRLESLANSKQEGKIVDLLLSIDRPPAYKLLISPISHLSPYKQFIGDNELPALIIGYGAFISVLGFMVNITRSLL